MSSVPAVIKFLAIGSSGDINIEYTIVYVKSKLYNGLMSQRTLGILALLLSTIFWGAGPVFSKIGISQIPPFSFAFLRLSLALILILPFLFALKHHKIAKTDIKRFILIGIVGSGLNAIFFMAGLSKTTASTASAIFATVPLLNAVAASLVLKEIPSAARILGVMIGFLGSAIITLGSEFESAAQFGDVGGNLLVFGAAIFWVFYIVLSKELLNKYQPITITTYSFLVGAVTLFPLAIFEIIKEPNWYQNVGINAIIGLVYGAVFAGLLAFIFFQWGLRLTSAFEAGISTYLQPVITALIAIPVLGEFPQPIFITGTVLILGGIFLATTYELVKRKREQ